MNPDSTTGKTPASYSGNSEDPINAALAQAAAKQAQFMAFRKSDDGKKLIAWVNAEYSRMKTAKVAIQREWYINLAMYYGQQYLEILSVNSQGVATSGSLGVPKAPKHRVRTTVNLIRPMIRTEISRMTSQKPSATVVPASGEDEAMMAAQCGEAVWEYLQARRDFDTIMVRACFWQCITGNGFVKTWWDKYKTDQYSRQGDGNGSSTGQPPVGDVCFGVVTPFNLFVPDYLVQDIEDQPYVFEAYTFPVQKVKNMFPDIFGDKDPVPDCVGSTEIFDNKYFLIPGSSNDAKPDAILFIEAWVKPGATDLLPNGGMVTLAGGEIVQYEPDGMPYSHGQYPYAKFNQIETGKFYADSTISDAKHLQKEYNRTRSQIIEDKNRMARPQLLIAKGSLDPSKITSEAGLLIEYNQGFAPPTPLPMQALPSYVLDEMNVIKSDLEDVSGQHQVSRGQSPGGGVQAATAISFLQERDDSLLYTAYQSIESGVEKIGRQSLVLYADYMDLPRIIRITGTDGAFDSLEFKGSDITNGLDLRIEGGSALPMSKPARQAFLMDMYKMGAITSDQMLDMMDIGGVQKLTERLRIDMRAAQRENIRMKKLSPEMMQQHANDMMQEWQTGSDEQQDPQTGEMNNTPDPSTWPPVVPVHDFDNHQVHIDTHNAYRKGQEFETLPVVIQQEFAKHIQLHQIALAQGSGQAMMGMPTPGGAMPGAPGAPGGQPGGMPPPGNQAQPGSANGMPPAPLGPDGSPPSPVLKPGQHHQLQAGPTEQVPPQ